MSNWAIPKPADLNKVISQVVLTNIESNTGANVNPSNPVSGTQPLRSAAAVALAIERIRGAVSAGGRVPLSVCNGVPPEAEHYTLILAVWNMAGAQPDVGLVVMGPHGNVSPFYNEYKDATDWLKMVSKGEITVTYPSDPLPSGIKVQGTGDTVQLGVKWGDLYGTDQQYAAGTQPDKSAPFSMTTCD